MSTANTSWEQQNTFVNELGRGDDPYEDVFPEAELNLTPHGEDQDGKYPRQMTDEGRPFDPGAEERRQMGSVTVPVGLGHVIGYGDGPISMGLPAIESKSRTCRECGKPITGGEMMAAKGGWVHPGRCALEQKRKQKTSGDAPVVPVNYGPKLPNQPVDWVQAREHAEPPWRGYPGPGRGTSAQCGRCHGKYDDSQLRYGLCPNCRKETSKVARKNYTPAERLALIEEQGKASNAHKLEPGEHFDEDPGADLAWALGLGL